MEFANGVDGEENPHSAGKKIRLHSWCPFLHGRRRGRWGAMLVNGSITFLTPLRRYPRNAKNPGGLAKHIAFLLPHATGLVGFQLDNEYGVRTFTSCFLRNKTSKPFTCWRTVISTEVVLHHVVFTKTDIRRVPS